MQRNVTRSSNVKDKLKQLLKEIKSIDQETIDYNLQDFTNRNGMIRKIEVRLEDILNNGDKYYQGE